MTQSPIRKATALEIEDGERARLAREHEKALAEARFKEAHCPVKRAEWREQEERRKARNKKAARTRRNNKLAKKIARN